jgi:hypothetical protein
MDRLGACGKMLQIWISVNQVPVYKLDKWSFCDVLCEVTTDYSQHTQSDQVFRNVLCYL